MREIISHIRLHKADAQADGQAGMAIM